jgi:hypothetical protein
MTAVVETQEDAAAHRSDGAYLLSAGFGLRAQLLAAALGVTRVEFGGSGNTVPMRAKPNFRSLGKKSQINCCGGGGAGGV